MYFLFLFENFTQEMFTVVGVSLFVGFVSGYRSRNKCR